MLSPLQLRILLHCYTTVGPVDNAHLPVVKETLEFFLSVGVIEPVADGDRLWRCTALGEAWVKVILDTPVPRIAFLDQWGREIDQTPR